MENKTMDSDPARSVETLTSSPRLKAWDSRVPMSGCLGAHHGTAVGRGLLRSRRPTLSPAGATPAMPAASLVTFPDAGRCRDLGISPGDSVVLARVADGTDTSRRACPRPKAPGYARRQTGWASPGPKVRGLRSRSPVNFGGAL